MQSNFISFDMATHFKKKQNALKEIKSQKKSNNQGRR